MSGHAEEEVAAVARKSLDNTDGDGPLQALEEAVRKAGSARAFAAASGLSHGYVSDVRAGRREPGPAVLAALGLEKVVSYVPAGEARS